MAATSSPNFRSLMPSAVTMSGVPSSGAPMRPIGTPPDILIVNGSRAGKPFLNVTLAPRKGNFVPR
jgi:hypothetical protein